MNKIETIIFALLTLGTTWTGLLAQDAGSPLLVEIGDGTQPVVDMAVDAVNGNHYILGTTAVGGSQITILDATGGVIPITGVSNLSGTPKAIAAGETGTFYVATDSYIVHLALDEDGVLSEQNRLNWSGGTINITDAEFDPSPGGRVYFCGRYRGAPLIDQTFYLLEAADQAFAVGEGNLLISATRNFLTVNRKSWGLRKPGKRVSTTHSDVGENEFGVGAVLAMQIVGRGGTAVPGFSYSAQNHRLTFPPAIDLYYQTGPGLQDSTLTVSDDWSPPSVQGLGLTAGSSGTPFQTGIDTTLPDGFKFESASGDFAPKPQLAIAPSGGGVFVSSSLAKVRWDKNTAILSENILNGAKISFRATGISWRLRPKTLGLGSGVEIENLGTQPVTDGIEMNFYDVLPAGSDHLNPDAGNTRDIQAAYIVKFSTGTVAPLKMAVLSKAETKSRIEDMIFEANRLHAIQTWDGQTLKDGGGAEQSTGTTADVAINRFGSELGFSSQVFVKGPSELRGYGISVDPRTKNVFVSGRFGSEDHDFGAKIVPGAGNSYFFGVVPENLATFTEVTVPESSPSNHHPALIAWNELAGSLAIAGSFSAGQLSLREGADVSSLLESSGSGDVKGFYTQLKDNGNFAQNVFLTVESEFGTPTPETPAEGLRGVQGESFDISVPEHVYENQSGVISDPEDSSIRRTVTGYTITYDDDSIVTGSGNKLKIVLDRNTRVTFHWRTDYALEIESRVEEVGLDPGESHALGNPFPVVKTHWIPEGELVTTFIDSVARKGDDFETRYAVTGYDAIGAADSSDSFPTFDDTDDAHESEQNYADPEHPFGEDLVRQQIPEFVMSAPGKIAYRWKIQHSIRVSTSSTESASLPGIDVVGTDEAPDEPGSGVFWFDQGSHLIIATRNGSETRSGILSATGFLSDYSGENPTDSSFGGGGAYEGFEIESLTGGGSIVWNYTDRINKQVVVIGHPVLLTDANPFGFDPDEVLTNDMAASINLTSEPTVTAILDAPPGSTVADMQIWDPQARKSYPLRPGRFLIEWETAGESGDTIITEITSLFPGDASIANPEFSESERFTTGTAIGPDSQSRDIALGDLDGDGDIDLIVGRRNLTNLRHLNNGDGTFSPGEAIGTLADQTWAVALGDVDGDGDLDLVVGNGDDAQDDRLYFNQGNGEFADWTHVADTPTRATKAIAFADVDNDGDLDIFAANGTVAGGAQVNRLYLNDGRGSFTASDLTTDSHSSWACAAGDVNGDGWVDLVVANFDAVNRLYLNDGEGGFPSGTDIGSSDFDSFAVALGDIDADDDLDAVFGDGTVGGANKLYINGGSAFDPAPIDLPIPGLTRAIAIQDLDLDGDLDIVVGNANGANDPLPAPILINDGTGTFSTAGQTQLPNNPRGISALALADLDRDGDIDVLGASKFGSELLFRNQMRVRVPGQPDYLHLNHAAMPPVDLDPEAGDTVAFLDLKYSEAGSQASAQDGQFIVGANDTRRSVLLFSQSTDQRTATGSRPEEELRVRVVETRNWFQGLTDESAAQIGRPLQSSADEAALGSGFLVYTEATDQANLPYNASIYNRQLVANAGPIIPVNRSFPDDETLNDLNVVWYKRTDGILWPNQSTRFRETVWPTVSAITDIDGQAQPLDRIVIASRLGSEGKNGRSYDSNGDPMGSAFHNDQFVFDPDLYSDVTIYNQPDPELPGCNPNEEHALIAPSFKFLDSPNPPPAVFALRSGDLNVTIEDETYTSDPYVLAQYKVIASNQWRMAVYRIELEDTAFGIATPQKFPEEDPDPENPEDQREFRYIFHYQMEAGEPVQAPYPLNRVIGATACDDSSGKNGHSGDGSNDLRAYWEDHKGTPWAVSAGKLRAFFYYPLQPGFTAPVGAVIGECVQFLPIATAPTTIKYTASWPTELPILKVGETLSYPGGEYKSDNQEAPGLPGVVGWAAGEVVFDSMNGLMSTDPDTIRENFVGRLISPLGGHSVDVQVPRAEFLSEFDATTGRTSVDGTTWSFNDLSSSLGGRISYDPIAHTLTLIGYINGLTEGDSALTASPPPVYVMEPNILTTREWQDLRNLSPTGNWKKTVDQLYQLSRDPAELETDTIPFASENAPSDYLVGLRIAWKRNDDGEIVYETEPRTFVDEHGDSQTITVRKTDSSGNPIPELESEKEEHKPSLGPGLALVPNPALLDSTAHVFTDEFGAPSSVGYITLAENNHTDLGAAPVSLHIIKVETTKRYRGAIKTILADNVFAEKIGLRHTGDFGGNVDDLVFEWWYREADGIDQPTPDLAPNGVWQPFPDQTGNGGLGMFEINLEGTGGVLLSDNLFYVRYRHNSEDNSWSDWEGTESFTTTSINDETGEAEFEEHSVGAWAGAANSRPGDYQPQLAIGWIKRVMDRINPYESRFSDFRSNEVPATYTSMILQAGQRYEGPVALNPDRNVIDNVGLIELYSTVLERGIDLSIGLSQPVTTPGVNNALMLAANRISDLYMLLGNEAFSDAVDPTIGFGNGDTEYGYLASSMFSFQNQAGSLLEEELGLLRGTSNDLGRPVYNRWFWNFTKDLGEVAYATNYGIIDWTADGFIDESDAILLFPQGHGDAWGHYTTALKTKYRLLQHPFFNWQPRSEQYNLLDVVIDVDFLDERDFAEAAAARAKAGADIVNRTYRERYVEDPNGQWQGYTDVDEDRAWGVQGWSRRTGQGALFDWMTANALIPAEDTQHTPGSEEIPGESTIKRVDRTTVDAIGTIAAHLGEIENQYANANAGLNPLGISPDAVPFDFDPTFLEVGSTAQIGSRAVQGLTHFDQIWERALTAVNNANAVFDHANESGNRVREALNTQDSFWWESLQQDREYKNGLLEIFGSPYGGQIGTGKAYPAGYSGPDIYQWMYVDRQNVQDGVNGLLPDPESNTFRVSYQSFYNVITRSDEGDFSEEREFRDTQFPYFVNDLMPLTDRTAQSPAEIRDQLQTVVATATDENLELELPILASGYSFQATPQAEWGRRAAPGELQSIIADLLVAEGELKLAQKDYDNYVKELQDMADLLGARFGLAAETVRLKRSHREKIYRLNAVIQSFRTTSEGLLFAANLHTDISDAISSSIADTIVGLASTPFKHIQAATKAAGATGQFLARTAAFALEQSANITEADKERIDLNLEIDLEIAGTKFEIREALKEIEQHLRNEPALRIEIFNRLETMRQTSDQYRSALERGLRLLQEREDYAKIVASATQSTRYKDMAFRNFRNDALRKYEDAFDLAARYTYLAAKAYDYETNLSKDDPASAQSLFEDIVRERTVGLVVDGVPQTGRGGLAEVLATMIANFEVLRGRMGFNNAQLEEGRISLRNGFARIKDGAPIRPGDEDAATAQEIASDEEWRDWLQSHRVDDLWQLPEFRRYCRPPRPQDEAPLPGLVIEFPATVEFGKNFFGWPLGPGDHAYDPTVFATKIQSAGVWFEDYDTSQLASAPRVYLIPSGLDTLSVPDSPDFAVRNWNIVDQAMPVPFPVGQNVFDDPNWLAASDSFDEPIGKIRRYSSFRAYGTVLDAESTVIDDAELVTDARLVGRSVRNNRWMLIITGGTFLAEGEEGLERFINGALSDGLGSARDGEGVSDIYLFFQTYGYSGN